MLLIIVRHGEQDYGTGSLTEKGRADVSSLAERLKADIPAGKLLLASSDTPRTMETADILAAALPVDKRMKLPWLQDGELAGRRARTLADDDDGPYTAAVLVTHLPVANEMLGSFAKEFELDDPPPGPLMAEAIVVDDEKKTFARI